MNSLISVIIPCKNNAHTIGACLQSVFQSDYKNYEVIVIDDHSNDNSRDIIRNLPCRKIRLPTQQGAGYARKIGTKISRGKILFFASADYALKANALQIAADSMSYAGTNAIIGATITRLKSKKDLFHSLQYLDSKHSQFIRNQHPEYIARQAWVMSATLLRQQCSFKNREIPSLEDAEHFNHLKRKGVKLLINPALQVQPISSSVDLQEIQNTQNELEGAIKGIRAH